LLVLAQYVRQTLRTDPQVSQLEAESRASESRVGEAQEGFMPRVTVAASLGTPSVEICRDQHHRPGSTNRLRKRVLTVPLIDQSLSCPGGAAQVQRAGRRLAFDRCASSN